MGRTQRTGVYGAAWWKRDCMACADNPEAGMERALLVPEVPGLESPHGLQRETGLGCSSVVGVSRSCLT